MSAQRTPSAEPRTPLTRERVVRAAIELADRDGIESLSLRKLGHALGVEAMSLYNHVRNKDDLLDGMVEIIIGEIDLRPSMADWKTALRERVLSARAVLLRHAWAPRVIQSRSRPGSAFLRYLDSVLGTLREGGFSIDLAHHAMHVMGSRVLGFTQDLFDDAEESGPGPELAAVLARELADKYPYVTEMALAVSHEGGLGGCDDDQEFAFALDLILDGLGRLRDR